VVLQFKSTDRDGTTHIVMSAQPPPRAPARRVERFQAACDSIVDWSWRAAMGKLSPCARAGGQIGRKSAAAKRKVPGKPRGVCEFSSDLRFASQGDRVPVSEK
jgi:hypothetical protein